MIKFTPIDHYPDAFHFQPLHRYRIQIPIASLPTQTNIYLPVTVIHGREEGATLWLSAALHGDEINGVEIIRQVVQQVQPKALCGTLIAVPIVNIFGFLEQSRYLPDRRDLNRCFPGSANGSLASRLAHLFLTEIVDRSTHGIDLHTASDHRTNLPQIRANLENGETFRCAQAFGAPLMMHSNSRDGSLREAAAKRGISVLLYEGGEALRFDEEVIHIGCEGIFRVMAALSMCSPIAVSPPPSSRVASQAKWVRASHSGLLRLTVKLGDWVEKKQVLGTISDTFGDKTVKVKATVKGIIIGHSQKPLVYQGDALFHLAIVD